MEFEWQLFYVEAAIFGDASYAGILVDCMHYYSRGSVYRINSQLPVASKHSTDVVDGNN